MDYMEKRIADVEKEIKVIKSLLKNNKKKPVSFRGIAKTKLSKKELDREIKRAKKSLFFHGEV